jgi:hypothetical protein
MDQLLSGLNGEKLSVNVLRTTNLCVIFERWKYDQTSGIVVLFCLFIEVCDDTGSGYY